MTRARWILSAVTLFLLWLAGALVLVPRMEQDLEAAAHQALAKQPMLAEQLGGVSLTFDGLQARLSGKVRNERDRRVIENTLRDLVRAPTPLASSLGMRLNPVTAVLGEIDVVPFPAGWMLLAATGAEARLLGTAATLYEARDIARSVQESWSVKGGAISGIPGADGAKHDEAANASATLRGVPAPRQTAQAQIARIGQPWMELMLEKDDAALFAQASAAGVGESEWQRHVLPVLRDLRATLERQRGAEAENQRLSRLPPGHLFIAAHDSQVVLRGEVGTPAMKRAILDEALHAFAPRRVHDEIRVSAQRRPTGDFGPITIALLPSGKNKRSLFFGLGGEAWKSVDWQITPAEQSWKEGLPVGIDRGTVQNDSALLTGWLSGDGSHELPPLPKSELPVVVLTLFGTKAVLAGRVAEESTRAQLIAAARQAYGQRQLVQSDDLHVRATCQPSMNLLHTLKSLPPAPAAESAGLLAIAKPGGVWTVIPAGRELLEAGGLARQASLPEGISAGLVQELSSDALEQLRIWISNLKSPISRL